MALFKILFALTFFWSQFLLAQPAVRVGSKVFTESVILSEIIRHNLLADDISASEVMPLGATSFVWEALLNNKIDLYVEYTGTLAKQMFSEENIKDDQDLRALLHKKGLAASKPLGFSNNYALGMARKRALDLRIRSISDLKRHPRLKIELSQEFLAREDGYEAIRKAYDLPHKNIGALEHSVAIKGIEAGKIDVTDIYLTEAELDLYDIVPLEDDLRVFSQYDAIIVYREDLLGRCPDCQKSFDQISGTINTAQMRKLNAEVLIGKEKESLVAQRFLKQELKKAQVADIKLPSLSSRIIDRTLEHSFLVFVTMAFAIVFGVTLGIVAVRFPHLGKLIVSVVSVMQTIPSLALLVLMIPIFGVGTLPAMVALFCYALLPIVRNTVSGLSSIPHPLIESALVIGLSGFERLVKIELPMASRHILAGIKTAVIITVGTATLGALIGAGGYGQPILTGVRMLDMAQILEGAVPAAFFALFCQLIFSKVDKILIPKGLLLETSVEKIT